MTDSWKQNLYTAKSASEELEYYEKTAREYEDDFFKKMKYSGPEACMQSLLECEQKHGAQGEPQFFSLRMFLFSKQTL